MGNTILSYYLTQNDANFGTNLIDNTNGTTVQPVNGITAWKIIRSANGAPFDRERIYNVGDELAPTPGEFPYNYYLYPAIICFKEGSKVLCLIDDKEIYVPIEKLDKNMLVKTYKHGYKKIVIIGHDNIYNTANDNETLYKLSTNNYLELDEDLYITGKHALLVDSLTEEQKRDTIQTLGKIYITDDKYRLCACDDHKAEKCNDTNNYMVYHLALENEDRKMNYGIYVNGGLLVESCSIFRMNNSNLQITN